MSSPASAPRAATETAASLTALLSPARAEASRKNGAKSRGPKTPEGRARSAQNALKHGMRAQQCVVLPGERASAFAAFEAALLAELAPEGALQTVLAQRVVAASWRLARAERLEAELFARNMLAGRSLGLALIRDCNGARAFDTLLRYRGGTLAELWRALRALQALQAEAAQEAPARRPRPQPEATPDHALRATLPNQPEAGRNPGDSTTEATSAPDLAAALPETATALEAAADPAPAACTVVPGGRAALSATTPIEPEGRGNPGKPPASTPTPPIRLGGRDAHEPRESLDRRGSGIEAGLSRRAPGRALRRALRGTAAW